MQNDKKQMQALILTAINELKLVDVPIPTIEQPNDVLLKVKSVGVCGSDLHGYTGQSGRRTPPIIMGHEVTAKVVAVGEAAKGLPIGTRVAIQPVKFCGQCSQCRVGQRNLCEKRQVMGVNTSGAYAPYVVWPATNLFPLPDTLSDEAGALAEPLSVALHAVSLTSIKPDDTAFIAGAGPIGLLTLAALKQMGVQHIAVSDVSNRRLEIAQSLGAMVMINPIRENPRQVVDTFTDGRGVDLAFEAVGISATVHQTLEVTRNKGTVIWIGLNHRMIEIDMQAIVARELKVLGSYGMNDEDFQQALTMLAEGHIPTAQLINRRVSLTEGPKLFDELLQSPEIIKCVINFP